MIKKCIISLLCLTLPCWGAIFHIPGDLQIEQDQLIQKVTENPENPELRFELAMNLAYTGWVELGWEQLKTVDKLQKNYEVEVFKKYNPLLESDPDNWKHHFKIAFAYYFKKDKDRALNHFIKSSELNPKNPWPMGFIALLYGEKKDYKACKDWCKKGLKIEPDATAIHFLLAKAYLDSGDYFNFLGESVHVGRLKSAEAKYRPIVPSTDLSNTINEK